MKKIQLNKKDLTLGEPLSWPVYGIDGELLFEQGQAISSSRQIHILITRGLYREATIEESRQLDRELKFSLSSPFNVLDAIRINVTRILDDMNNSVQSNYTERTIKVATVIQKLCYENADAALGAIILDQTTDYIHIHPVMCALLTELLLRRKKIPQQDRLLYIAAALTQNIGMLDLQSQLNQQTEPLSPQQRQNIDQHPLISVDILRNLGVADKEWLDTVLNHHEKPDGSGYPNGFKAEQISLQARTLSLCDIYSAMILPREYRDGYFIKKALRDIFLQRGSTVDHELAQLLIRELGIYPPGTFVQLLNGDIAIVTRRAIKQANAPQVLSIISPRGTPYKHPQQRNTKLQDLFGITKVLPRPENLTLNRNQIWGLGRK
jgi:HD-GYP domain-containing protein (c-di-GMP phosphodiesterase class II)